MTTKLTEKERAWLKASIQKNANARALRMANKVAKELGITPEFIRMLGTNWRQSNKPRHNWC